MMSRHIIILLLNFLFLYSINGQKVLIDQGIQAKDLFCFPVYGKSNTYKYLPSDAHLAIAKNGLPAFSYMRYILENPAEKDSDNSITKADGGGILHFLVQYDTPSQKVKDAELFLQKKFKNDSIQISGPVQLNKGRYTMVSSILNPKSGEKENSIIGSGESPITEGTNLALSFNVNPLKSKLLLESLKMSTPAVSLVFELSFSGITNSYEAEVDFDWSEIKKSKLFDAGGSAYFIGADVGLAFDSLRRDHVIKLTSVGNDSAMEGLVQTVYGKLLELMFNKVPLEQIPNKNKGSIEDAISSLLGSEGILGSKNTTGFGLNIAYQHKEHRSTGSGHLEFKGRNTVNRNHFITFNVGNIFKEYGDNQEIFKEVPLWDPAFLQRNVYIGLDGDVIDEFQKMVNSVTVKVKKQHLDGSETIKEVFLTKSTYKKKDGEISATYLNHKDTVATKWLEFEYQSIWKFVGGATYVSDWKTETAAMINLYVPFNRHKIQLAGDMEVIKTQNIRAVSTNISYPFFGEKRKESLTIYPTDILKEKFFEITLPRGEEAINYNINWHKKNEQPIKKEGVTNYRILFIDEIPKE